MSGVGGWGRWIVRGVLLTLLLTIGIPVAVYAPLFDRMATLEIDRQAGDPAGPVVAASGRKIAGRRVWLISVDGLAPWVIEASRTPTLRRLAHDGSSAGEAKTVLPSITLTSHTSMLSGVSPEVHAVRFNRYQPWSRIDDPTLFTLCARQGLVCGLFAGKVKFVHFAEHEPGVERYVYAPSAEQVFDAALRFAHERDPDFGFVHLAEVDRSGHAEGWGSDAQLRSIEEIDGLLGRFIAALDRVSVRPLSVIVTSDHGGRETRHDQGRPDDVAIPWLAWGDGIAPGVLPDPVSTLDTAATAAALLDIEVPREWEGRARALLPSL